MICKGRDEDKGKIARSINCKQFNSTFEKKNNISYLRDELSREQLLIEKNIYISNLFFAYFLYLHTHSLVLNVDKEDWSLASGLKF